MEAVHPTLVGCKALEEVIHGEEVYCHPSILEVRCRSGLCSTADGNFSGLTIHIWRAKGCELVAQSVFVLWALKGCSRRGFSNLDFGQLGAQFRGVELAGHH